MNWVTQHLNLEKQYPANPIIRRSRLLEPITKSFSPGMLLTVIGEAGTGKTQFVRQLVSELDLPHGWVPLRTLSSSLINFVNFLAHQFATIWPSVNFSPVTVPPHGDVGAAAFGHFEALLDQVMIQSTSTGVVVFDNWEIVPHGDPREKILDILLRRLSELISVIVISRTPSPLLRPPRLLASRRIRQVLGNDLHFDIQETKAYLAKACKKDFSDEDVRWAHEFTKGWPALLALLALEFGQQAPHTYIFPDKFELLFEYLEQEYWSNLSHVSKRALALSSLLEPFDKDILQNISQGITELKWEEFLPLTPYLEKDEQGQWGYYSAFAEFLRIQSEAVFDAGELQEIHSRAAKYFLQRPDVERATKHILAIGDKAWAWNVFKDHHTAMVIQGDYEVIARLGKAFSENQLKAEPDLALSLAEASMFAGDLETAEQVLKMLYDLPRIPKALSLRIGLRLAEVYLYQGRNSEVVHVCRLVEKASLRFAREKIEAQVYLAIAYNQLNLREKEEQYWTKVSAVATDKLLPLKPHDRSYLLAPKAIFYHIDRSQFDEADRLLEQAIQAFSLEDPRHRLPWVLFFKGALKRELFQFEQAQSWLQQATKKSSEVNRGVHARAAALLALTLVQLGRGEESARWLEIAKFNAHFDRSSWTQVIITITEAELSSSQTEIKEKLTSAYNLAAAEEITYVKALAAFSAFSLRKKMLPPSFCISLVSEVLQDATTLQIKHRQARCTFYLKTLELEGLNCRISDDELLKALEICRKHKLNFLLTANPWLDSLALGRYCLAKGLATEYWLGLWRSWGVQGCRELACFFDELPSQTKVRVAELWASMGFDQARPLLAKARNSVASVKTKRLLEKSLHQLENLPPKPLAIKLLGGFEVRRGDDEKIQEWGRQRAKDMLKFLVLNKPRPVPADVLMETFWPDIDLEKAQASLWSAVTALRNALEPGLAPRAKSSYLKVEKGVYRLELPQGSSIDIEVFEQLVSKGLSLNREGKEVHALECLKEAERIYKADLLPEDLYEDWVAPFREKFSIMLRDSLKAMLSIGFEMQSWDECVRICNKLIGIDPWDEEAYVYLMKIYMLQGMETEALKVYKRCEQTLKEELNLPPSKQLEDLRQRLEKRRKFSLNLA